MVGRIRLAMEKLALCQIGTHESERMHALVSTRTRIGRIHTRILTHLGVEVPVRRQRRQASQ